MPRRRKDYIDQKVIAALSSSTAGDGATVQYASELNTVLRLGWSVIDSNLRLGPYSPSTIADIHTHYSRIFDFRSPGSIPLNLRSPVDPAAYDLLGRAYEQCLHATGARKTSGEYYSHPEIVRYMVDSLDLENDPGLARRRFVDIACGTGIFLTAALKRTIMVLQSHGVPAAEIVEWVPACFYGLDLNPIACMIARINLYLTLLNELGPGAMVEADSIGLKILEADAIENRAGLSDAATLAIKHRSGGFRNGFDYILGNPPYLEAKQMSRELKEQCKANFPELEGAFDLYMAFLSQCNRLVSRDGKVHLILPDKFTVARYSESFRRRILDHMTLLEVADLSGMDVFSRARIYPVLLYYQNTPPEGEHRVHTRIATNSQAGDLFSGQVPVHVPQALYKEVGDRSAIFCMPPGNGFVEAFRLIFKNGVPMGNYLHFRSAITFHKKGLREQFVRKAFEDPADASRIFKYLGGRSYTRKNEVELLGFDWQGYYIDYDQAALKHLKNKLPALDVFAREKIVFCQHARRIIAAYDGAGEYVCKDVYPIALTGPKLGRSPFSLRYFAGLLNSELMSFVYNTLYRGIQIKGGYYHYLPTWIEALPVMAPESEDITHIEEIVARAGEEQRWERRAERMEAVDEIVYRTYGITPSQQAAIKKLVPPWPGKSIGDLEGINV
ncbi:Eco57I restriction-modification methylase domain-containing protein [Methanocella sp. MCL-LM]|uniref:Eco57I restriction-modification methylase domain-containing protein n=1 Tax=Methanocella sp. MCL-LM TaxID=3412035 RepID=UPI003C707F1F